MRRPKTGRDGIICSEIESALSATFSFEKPFPEVGVFEHILHTHTHTRTHTQMGTCKMKRESPKEFFQTSFTIKEH